MGENVCPQCGAPITVGAASCKYCGEQFATQMAQQQIQQPAYQQPGFQQPVYQQNVYVQQMNPNLPLKSKTAAGLLAIFLGGLGIHKFYLGKAGQGILYILFCWTYIPEILGLVEGIIYLTQSDEAFCQKNNCRVR